LANALEPFTGKVFAQFIFGIGVMGMAISTIIILMLISGFSFCEMLNVPSEGWPHRIGCLIPGVVGVFFPIIWTGESKVALAVPTSVIGGALLPIAYFTFLLLMNSKKLLGDKMPQGNKRLVWNLLMGLATAIAAFGSIWGLNGRTLPIGNSTFPIGNVFIFVLAAMFIIGLFTFIAKNRSASS
jgi:Mn2+/Fe2+ NRAMP family transporter